jgi:hypothetical protein
MKFLATIMAVYLIGLSLLPCNDKQDIVPNGKESVKISVLTDHHEEHHTTDTCTPFCNCSCCSIPAFFHAAALSVHPEGNTKPGKSYLKESFVSHNDKSIWQPPRLS